MSRIAKTAVVALLMAAPLLGREQSLADDLQAMAAAERSFAQRAAEKGVRDAFVEFFADDSVGFYPTPMNAREFYRKQPPTPATQRLEWEPRVGDLADSGELGWLAGPYASYDTASDAPRRYGCYFSIWAKRDGAWKVLMDVGVPTPEPVVFAEEGFAAVPPPGGRYAPRPQDASDATTATGLDNRFAAALDRNGTEAAYDQVLTAVSRVHVPGRQPLVGRDAILAWLRESTPTLRTTADGGDVAHSRDLAFARGSYEETRGAGAEARAQKGYFVRVWRRVANGDWKLAVEVRNPA